MAGRGRIPNVINTADEAEPDWAVITGPVIEVPEIPDGISSGRRRTLKRLVMLELGKHPVTQVPLHPQAPEDASRKDRYPRDFTCGTCEHRFMWEYLGTSWGDGPKYYRHPKCDLLKNVSKSSTTDVARWLPACLMYRPVPVDNVTRDVVE